MRASSAMCGRIRSAPSAQLKPDRERPAWRTEFQNASTVWPDSVRPERSVMVPEIQIGSRAAPSSSRSRIALIAALAFRVSKIVSTRKKSTPPWCRPRLLAIGDVTSSKVTGAAPGSLTSDDIDSVRLSGPMAPATKRGLSRRLRSSAVARLAGQARGGEVDVRRLRHGHSRPGDAGRR